MKRHNDEVATGAVTRQQLSEEIRHRRRLASKCRQVLPPDAVHGEVAVGEVIDVWGRRWAHQALFVVESAGVVTVAYFDDHFLFVEQWTPTDEISWQQWWRSRSAGRRVVALRLQNPGRIAEEETELEIAVSRRRLIELEKGVLGVTRDGEGPPKCRGELDVLSLVTLTARLSRMRKAS